jgi:hypothetical protein
LTQHFFAAAAEAMRRILMEDTRRSCRQKRGGSRRHVELDEMELTIDEPPDDLLALDEALQESAQKHRAKAELVKLLLCRPDDAGSRGRTSFGYGLAMGRSSE